MTIDLECKVYTGKYKKNEAGKVGLGQIKDLTHSYIPAPEDSEHWELAILACCPSCLLPPVDPAALSLWKPFG